jgi:hypothetical protein
MFPNEILATKSNFQKFGKSTRYWGGGQKLIAKFEICAKFGPKNNS